MPSLFRPFCSLIGLTLLLAVPVFAVEHRVEKLDAPPPADSLSPDVAGQLSPHGLKVLRGGTRTVCEIWLCREWPVIDGFKPTPDVLFPFTPGQLIGVVRYPKKGTDFRDQAIPEGVYTLRYGQQPVDGAHVGTSPTRDFLVLLPAAADVSAGKLDMKELGKKSAAGIGTTHPGLLSMQPVAGKAADAIRHQEEKDWWIVRLQSKGKAGAAVREVTFDLVVVGKAGE